MKILFSLVVISILFNALSILAWRGAELDAYHWHTEYMQASGTALHCGDSLVAVSEYIHMNYVHRKSIAHHQLSYPVVRK